jgi:ribosome-binding protein aMBF1 (putative translation factor)
MKNKKIKLEKWSDVKKKLLSDSLTRKSYDNLEFEFKIYEAIIEARFKKNLSQRELADKIGIAQSALARFESGRTNPTLSFLKKITSGLGLKITIL